MTTDASDTAEQQIATLRQELAAARDSRKRLVWAVRKWRKDVVYADAQIKKMMSDLEAEITEERTQSEAALAAALQREQQMREALETIAGASHTGVMATTDRNVARLMGVNAVAQKALAAPADAQETK